MTAKQWKSFCVFRDDFRSAVENWSNQYGERLIPLQKTVCAEQNYPVENPIVYNTALDVVSESDEIKIIVIGDNPGKNEQLSANKKYLIGQSGKIAENFFKRETSLTIDFRKNALILNKTPVHSAKTVQLKEIAKMDEKAAEIIRESQIFMAEKTAAILLSLADSGAELWLTGYSELKVRGIFAPYRERLFDCLSGTKAWENVRVYQHFSMNRFLVDLKNCGFEDFPLKERLKILGNKHKNEIFSI